MIKKIFISIIYIFGIFVILDFEKEKKQIIKNGRDIEAKYLIEKEKYDKAYQQFESTYKNMSNDEKEKQQIEFRKKHKNPLSKYPHFYHSQNKANGFLMYQLVIITFLIGIPFVGKSKKKKTK